MLHAGWLPVKIALNALVSDCMPRERIADIIERSFVCYSNKKSTNIRIFLRLNRHSLILTHSLTHSLTYSLTHPLKYRQCCVYCHVCHSTIYLLSRFAHKLAIPQIFTFTACPAGSCLFTLRLFAQSISHTQYAVSKHDSWLCIHPNLFAHTHTQTVRVHSR